MTVALSFVGGLALLIVGAELLVRGAARIATAFRVSPLIIGLTVVAFATSSPELAVSAGSALAGQPDIALGNVLGSTIANILLILGLSALVVPLVVKSQLVRFDVPVMIGAAVLVLILGLDGVIGTLDAVALTACVIAYVIYLIRSSRAEGAELAAGFDEEYGDGPSTPFRDILAVLAGIGMLVVGSRLLLGASVAVAERLGISELVIGLTLIALGTSLPEIATSILAAVRGQRDIAVGNAVGSNVFNLLAVLGVSGIVAPGGIPVARGALDFDIPVMITVTVACLPIFFTGHLIARWEGALFLAYYVAYTTYLLLDAAGHDALAPFSTIMLWFVVPLTLVTLVGTVVSATRGPDNTA